MNLQNKTNQKGFTIVELLIVIVVIGILAAITIVAYNGIQNRAKASSAQSLANNISKKAEAFNTIESRYPTLAELTGNSGNGSAGNPNEAKLDAPTSASGTAPTTTNGTSIVQYVPCGATATAHTGARIHWFDYTSTATIKVTTPTTTPSSVTVGSC